MCYPVLVPTHCCSAYRHILEYQLAWRLCDEIIDNHEWKTLCLFHERDREKITVIEPTHMWCKLVDSCPVCDIIFKRPELVQASKRIKELKKSIIPKIRQTFKETREYRNLAMAMARAETTKARQERYEEANVLLDKLRKQQEEYEAELKEAENKIVEAGQPFVDDQINNARPQVQNIGRVTLIYCGPVGAQEAKERNHKPLPKWLEKDAKDTMPFGLVNTDPKFAKADPPLRKVDPTNPATEAEEYVYGPGYVPS